MGAVKGFLMLCLELALAWTSGADARGMGSRQAPSAELLISMEA